MRSGRQAAQPATVCYRPLRFRPLRRSDSTVQAPKAPSGSPPGLWPTEAPIVMRLHPVIDVGAGISELGEHRVEVIDPIVDHQWRAPWAEIVGVRWGRGPHSLLSRPP